MDCERCTACDSISGVYYDLCDDCMTSYNKLREENSRLWADRKTHDDYVIESSKMKAKHIRNIQRQAKAEVLKEVQAVLRKWWTIDDVHDELHDKLKQLEGE